MTILRTLRPEGRRDNVSAAMVPITFIGWSGAGKTTLLTRLVRHYAARGARVGVIKHTHHPVNRERRGDTGRFLDAGAAETILAAAGEAAHSDGFLFPWNDPGQLVARTSSPVLFAEGFRDGGWWPMIVVDRGGLERLPPIPERGLLAVVSDRDVAPPGVPRFDPSDIEALIAFLDTMTSSMNPRFRAIVFDLDGTLIDSYVALTRSINYARSRHGLEALDEEAIRGAVGDGVRLLLERTFAPVAVPPTAEADFEAYYDEICCEESRVLEDVEETLASLATRGIRMGVCTNKPTPFSAKILGHVGLASHFDAIVGPDAAGARKPDGRHVLHTLEAMRCTPREALFVGDMPVDVAAARDAGVPVAVLATGSSPRVALEAARPDFLLERFRDLLPLVAGEPRP